MVYAVCFAFSYCFIKMATYAERKRVKHICIILSASVVVLLAAVRDVSVGKDVLVYQVPLFQIAKRYLSFVPFFRRFFRVGGMEPLYIILVYVSSRISTNIFWLFFFSESLIVYFVYKTILYYWNEFDPDLSLLCFLCCYYLMSLCLTRQFISICIVFYSTTWLSRKKYFIASIFIMLATGFHSSAIIGFAMMILYILGRNPIKKSALTFISIVSVVVSAYFRNILIFLVKMLKILPQRYISKEYLYLSTGNNFSISRTAYVLMATLIVIFVFLNSSNREGYERQINTYYLMYMMIISLAGVLIGSRSSHIYRIALYCEMYTILIFPNALFLVTSDKRSQTIGKIILIFFLVAYCVFTYIIKTGYGVWPYAIAHA